MVRVEYRHMLDVDMPIIAAMQYQLIKSKDPNLGDIKKSISKYIDYDLSWIATDGVDILGYALIAFTKGDPVKKVIFNKKSLESRRLINESTAVLMYLNSSTSKIEDNLLSRLKGNSGIKKYLIPTYKYIGKDWSNTNATLYEQYDDQLNYLIDKSKL